MPKSDAAKPEMVPKPEDQADRYRPTSAAGMPVMRDVYESPKDPLYLVQKNLQSLGIEAKTLTDSYLTLEQLASLIHKPSTVFSQSEYFRNGVLPIILSEEDGKYNTLLALKGEQGEGQRPTGADDLVSRVSDLLHFQDKINREGISYLVLSFNDYNQLLKLATNEDERRNFLQSIDEVSSAETAFYRMLTSAVKKDASDVHLEPVREGLYQVRFRIDGVLDTQDYDLDSKVAERIVNVAKTKTGMDISKKYTPQDGSAHFVEDIIEQHPMLRGINIRASTLPLTHNEKLVMRILRAEGRITDVRDLGFPERDYKQLMEQIKSPQGLVLVTGPTGSGKTTTLYSLLNYINNPSINITTVEDPVEFDISGINQTSVDEGMNRGFNDVLRGMLRQDPDVIFVGEIRDSETARLAMRAANTGHLVFSTLHTNDSVSALTRLYDLEVDKSQIEGSLRSVLSQRLARRLCTNEDHLTSYNAVEELNTILNTSITGKFNLVTNKKNVDDKKCNICDGAGYRGRTMVPELWVLGEEERRLIAEGNQSHSDYTQTALCSGMSPLVVSGFEKAIKGETTLEELQRVIERDHFIRFRPQLEELITQTQSKQEQGQRAR